MHQPLCYPCDRATRPRIHVGCKYQCVGCHVTTHYLSQIPNHVLQQDSTAIPLPVCYNGSTILRCEASTRLAQLLGSTYYQRHRVQEHVLHLLGRHPVKRAPRASHGQRLHRASSLTLSNIPAVLTYNQDAAKKYNSATLQAMTAT